MQTRRRSHAVIARSSDKSTGDLIEWRDFRSHHVVALSFARQFAALRSSPMWQFDNGILGYPVGFFVCHCIRHLRLV